MEISHAEEKQAKRSKAKQASEEVTKIRERNAEARETRCREPESPGEMVKREEKKTGWLIRPRGDVGVRRLGA